MNTLEIAQAITEDDIKTARLLHFTWKADCLLDGMKNEVDKICREKGLTLGEVNTVFALTYARVKNEENKAIGFSQGGYVGNSWDDLKDDKNWAKVGEPVGIAHGSEVQVSVKQSSDHKILELINAVHGLNCNVTIVEDEKEDLE